MKETINKPIMVYGMTSYYQDEKGMKYSQFNSDFSTPVVSPYSIKAHVQRMRDGTLYVSELPKRSRSQAEVLFKTTHGTLSKGKDNRHRLTFMVDDNKLEHFCQWLMEETPKAVAFMCDYIENNKKQNS